MDKEKRSLDKKLEDIEQTKLTDCIGYVIDPDGLFHVPGFLPMEPWAFGNYQIYKRYFQH
jgi:hypothetical protein